VGKKSVKNCLAADSKDSSVGLTNHFNIIKKTLNLANFTKELGNLYYQRAKACGQVFEPAAIKRAFY
jgi:hypothetical protein